MLTIIIPRPPPQAFQTNFPTTEAPIFQGGGIFTLGGTNGIDWQDVYSEGGSPGGTAYGAGPSDRVPVTLYNDCIATVQGRFSATKHYSQIVIRKDAGYTPPDSHEVELLGLFDIAGHSAKGYELTFAWETDVAPVRWNGAAGDFDAGVCSVVSGTPFPAVDGDLVKAVFDSTSGNPLITLFRNGVQTVQWTDTSAGKILTGSPGIGFFARPGTGLDMKKYAVRGAPGLVCGSA